jgi:hypothetical protein
MPGAALRGCPRWRVADQRGNEILGNANTGHDYGTDLPGPDPWSLVEYLKTL